MKVHYSRPMIQALHNAKTEAERTGKAIMFVELTTVEFTELVTDLHWTGDLRPEHFTEQTPRGSGLRRATVMGLDVRECRV